MIDTNIEKGGRYSGLKLAKDGRVSILYLLLSSVKLIPWKTVLVPQPSDDPDDPLNWSSLKKHAILLIMAFATFVGDFGATCSIPTILLQAEEWHVSPTKMTAPTALVALMCGVSGLIWMPLVNCWGRVPTLFWTCLLGLGFTLGSALAPNYPFFYAMRVLQGITQSTPQSIGLAFVKDMFFFHEHARKIGIWYAIFISSSAFGPQMGYFMVGSLGTWRPVFWLNFAMAAVIQVMILMFCDESYYNRSVVTEMQYKRPRSERLLRVLGIWQLRMRKGYFITIRHSYARLLELLIKPVIPLVMIFYSAAFMWLVGINTTSALVLELPVSRGGYGLSSIALGCLYFTPILAVYIGETFGHWFNDWIANRYIARHKGLFVPEVRLWATYVGAILMIPGLVIVGQTVQYRLNIAGIIMGWGMFTFGVMVMSVATLAYVLDCYPTASGEVSALINFARLALGFSVGYFQMEWGAAQGYDVTFGLQAVIVVAAFLILIIIHRFGGRLRAAAGPVSSLAN